jgi:ubiquitin-protein ligase E3 A
MKEEQQKLFLQFATGSDRAPVNGLSTLPFHVGRLGPAGDRLPIASTCFNHLMIPEYETKEILKQKLMLAIQNAEGFGMI